MDRDRRQLENVNKHLIQKSGYNQYFRAKDIAFKAQTTIPVAINRLCQ